MIAQRQIALFVGRATGYARGLQPVLQRVGAYNIGSSTEPTSTGERLQGTLQGTQRNINFRGPATGYANGLQGTQGGDGLYYRGSRPVIQWVGACSIGL